MNDKALQQLALSSGPVDGAKAAREIATARREVGQLLDEISGLVVPEETDRVTRLRTGLDDFRTRVSLLGQVKAGKTALTNALIGSSGLLPSDVNPWTSVVTSIHLNTPKPRGKNAVFTFFSSAEWAEMVERGGKLGRMSDEAGLDLETDTLREQIDEMQRRTEARLGRNFQLLLDGRHSFAGHSPSLVEKYVCMGEEEMADQPGGSEGRYADVTRSADLYLDHRGYALPTVICDTPGVNDPFLVREAATLERIGDADICVLVLNANQALSTVDVSLMRVLRGLQNEQVILYVNRIDQLDDPDAQIPKIEASIRKLLSREGLADDVPMVFGSAVWAGLARFGEIEEISEASMDVLIALADARAHRLQEESAGDLPAIGTPDWNAGKPIDLSGLHELSDLIQQRSAEAVAAPALAETARDASDVVGRSLMLLREAMKDKATAVRTDLDLSAMVDELDSLLAQVHLACDQMIHETSEKMLMLMSGAYHDFVTQESETLSRLIAKGGDPADWAPDTEGLRRDLNVAYDRFVQIAPAKIAPIFEAAAARIESLYGDALNDASRVFSVAPPRPVEPGTPTSLMRTMTIDLSGGLVGTWLRRKLRPDTFVDRFREIAGEAMRETVDEIRDAHIADFAQRTRTQLHDFLAGHVETLQSLSAFDDGAQRSALRARLGVRNEVAQRIARLQEISGKLRKIADEHAPKESAIDGSRAA
ncbi:dynamin family protein [Jannaschia aquimarina]|uniref:Der_2 protein n=1 Tax=Jannaschia aquimarina TaxID=935700 RepID=A0A0D1EDG9_9RHOB|nr:dynamin family protein [Jannaschia aquimarina]KIT14981.1 GTPase Der [Jannaschia aquimarina]SNS61120.1 Dynamin family protein [Jannaschia aquimarina]